ncbi:MAG TPA: hypothetical protein VF144_07160 [Chitinophagaceae bacterium]
MRKLFTFLFIIIAFSTYSQDAIQMISKNYFRAHPFDSKFSTFILNLQRDPWFTTKEFNRRTDSTFFYLTGDYKNFNPFRFTPKKLKLIVAEEQIAYADSLRTLDTIINLQLIGIIDTNTASSKLVEKEFKRFHQSQSKRFDDFAHKTLGGNQAITGEMNSYFIYPYSIAPVTAAWGPMPTSKEYSFVLTVRFKVAQNQAIYITQPGEFKGL